MARKCEPRGTEITLKATNDFQTQSFARAKKSATLLAMSDEIPPISSPEDPLINSCPSCAQLIDVTALEPYSKIICQSCGDTIRVRTSFHHFEIVQQIGVGGMSRVFRATDTALKRDVALKILNRQCSSDERRVSQFEHEARITAAISHPNVVKVYSSGWDQGYFYIAMELVRGGSLDDKIRKHKRVSEAKVLEMAVQTARGLKAAQEVGLIHRDIKPGNILFADDGTAKIVDFGLALMIQAIPSADKELWATPYYVPPEKLNRGVEDHRSDLYSLGASLFHAVLGRPPCDTDSSSLEELRALKTQTVSLDEDDALLVSEETTNLLECTLQKDPDDRYETYDDFIKHAEFARQTLLKGGRSLVRSHKKKSRRPLAIASAIAAACLTTGSILRHKKAPESVVAESLQIVSDPTAAQNKTVSQEFTLARDALLRGELPEARESFLKLAKDAPQPTANWSVFNAGLCALLQNDAAGARQNFTELKPYGDDALSVFFKRVQGLMDSPRVVQAVEVQDLDANSYDAMGLLALGLKNWELGEAAPADTMLQRFNTGAPNGQASWVKQYHALVTPHLADLAQLRGWPDFNSTKLTGADASIAWERAQLAVANLRLPGAIKTASDRELARLKEQLDTLVSAESSQRATQAGSLLAEEEGKFRQSLLEADKLAADYHFTAAQHSLEQQAYQSASIKALSADHATLWQRAEEFLVQLGKDLPTGVDWEVPRVDGLVMKGKISSVGRDGLHFKVANVLGETLLAYSQIQPAALLRWAEQPLEDEKITDADDYYHRREMIVAFALKSHQMTLGGLRGEELAREHRGFNQLWQRVQAGMHN